MVGWLVVSAVLGVFWGSFLVSLKFFQRFLKGFQGLGFAFWVISFCKRLYLDIR